MGNPKQVFACRCGPHEAKDRRCREGELARAALRYSWYWGRAAGKKEEGRPGERDGETGKRPAVHTWARAGGGSGGVGRVCACYSHREPQRAFQRVQGGHLSPLGDPHLQQFPTDKGKSEELTVAGSSCLGPLGGFLVAAKIGLERAAFSRSLPAG